MGDKREKCDMYAGKSYRKIPFEHDDISLSLNTDGVQVFVSSNFSIWPLQLMVNELPYTIRRKNMMLGGLWFGRSKPAMNTFFKPLVSEMNNLSTTGVKWSSDNVTMHTSRVFPTVCVCDSPARCIVQNITQFNGEYGCPWCLDPGEVVEVGRGHARVYGVRDDLPEKRTADGFMQNAREALRNNRPQMGVKGPSVLLLLNNFSIVDNFTVDYMHAVCLGVVRYTTFLWFDSSSHTQNYYLGNCTEQVNGHLESIAPPSELTRFPSAIKLRKSWKASEWRSWLLHYSPIVLRGFLPVKYFNHWMLLVISMHFLLTEDTTTEQISLCESLLFDFVFKYQELYGKDSMKFNVHQLLHITDSVRNWGPIWAYSAFPYESLNGKLTKLFKGTQCVPQQIAKKFIMLKGLPALSCGAFLNNEDAAELFRKNVLGFDGHDLPPNDDVCHLGLPKNIDLTQNQLEALAAVGINCASTQVKAYKHVVTKNGYKLVSNQIQHKKLKRNNSCVQFNDSKTGIIELIISLCPNSCLTVVCECQVFYCIIRVMETVQSFSTKTNIYDVTFNSVKEVRMNNKLKACLLADISGKYVHADYKDKTWISLLTSAKELD